MSQAIAAHHPIREMTTATTNRPTNNLRLRAERDIRNMVPCNAVWGPSLSGTQRAFGLFYDFSTLEVPAYQRF